MPLLRIFLIFCLFNFCNSVFAQAKIYVSASGNDTAIGSNTKPLATITTAIRKARNLRRLNDSSIKNGVEIILQKGTHQVLQPIVLHAEDGGSNDAPTFIKGEAENGVIVSGGVQIANWKKSTVNKNIWEATVPEVNGQIFNFRQLWVNDVKATSAKSANGSAMHRIISWNKKTKTCIIPDLGIKDWTNAKQLELFIHQWWEIANLRISKIEKVKEGFQLSFYEPESTIQSEHPWPAPWMSTETGNSAFFLTNALQFVDEPNEWYLDVANKKIYYYALPNQNPNTTKIIAPYNEQIFVLQGTNEAPLKNIVIENIHIQHTGWLRPSLQGHVPHQAGMYMTEAYKLKPSGTFEKPSLDNQAWIGRQAAAITASYAQRLRIKNCTFQHLAATAVDLKVGVQDAMIKNNVFNDIGGTAIVGGNFGDEGREIHIPFNTTNENEICKNVLVENNFTTNTANEDWGCAAIAFGFTQSTTIQHNEVENTSYSGISLGWGWSPKPSVAKNNSIKANYIHHYGKHNYDCGGIYTLGNQPNTVIEDNAVDSIFKAPYAHLPTHWFYIYTDEGSDSITVKNNYAPSPKFLQNNNGNHMYWFKDLYSIHDSVRLQAGLENKYKHFRKYTSLTNNKQETNERRKELLEIIVDTTINKTFTKNELQYILYKNNIGSGHIYQWQNHYVVYDYVTDILVLKGRLQNRFQGIEVKAYHDLFYQYSKAKHCTNKNVEKEWRHYILTANLVSDTAKQNKYYWYHDVQFKDWPTVAEGFCNANFQELNLFRNGKQLMLVISVPANKTLDELNKYTTENNPKMIEWNKVMGKYQEGIEGTKKGETWVFLEQLHQQ